MIADGVVWHGKVCAVILQEAGGGTMRDGIC